ncbi:probable tRNA (uracil-O(2)-)-methyltransferase [Anopheles nili]|uniref:probable tRNA (uracil-O(2)-)-methyltransferase n=1 Tax=Anopheles nili TaxID=185578 RepID=UPI00237A41D3|nr:probable tRNA (uracil-O(2)-)-methyltransferase [Anopheles nili]
MFDHVISEITIEKAFHKNFWKAVDIYLFKTHLINKKLFGVNNISILSFKHGKSASTNEEQDPFLQDKLNETTAERFETEVRQHLIDHGYVVQVENMNNTSIDRLSQSEWYGVIVLNRLLPKNIHVFHPIDIVCSIRFSSCSVHLQCLQREKVNSLFPKFPFALHVSRNSLAIRCNSTDSTDERSIYWLREVLMERMHKWMVSSSPAHSADGSKAPIRSLALVENLEEYNCLFHKLKQKYGKAMVSIWPECTDPQKFVFEDIAIATYLITLWKKERLTTGVDKLQSFVDIGCGNGLLVYILASEGHQGYGIDLRKRKLWDLYPVELTIDLRVQTIVPSNASLFPDIDWIIGNHSDELSPWIPVIAARSSYSCRFFLLPCCAYEFDGSKYQRQNCLLSQYGDFLNYANEIARVCGFCVKMDRLRIPSTKRTCIIGDERTYSEAEFDIQDTTIKSFISDRTKLVSSVELKQRENTTTDSTTASWSTNFKPRESVERVRNCTKIDRTVVDKIVMVVFKELLAKRRVLPEHSERNWNAGGTITMEALVKLIPQEYLLLLKAECGGLQTLLRNNHQIFRVENGAVQLRIPSKMSEAMDAALKRKLQKNKNFKPINFKQRECWFFVNHPDGCPLMENECRFSHSDRTT